MIIINPLTEGVFSEQHRPEHSQMNSDRAEASADQAYANGPNVNDVICARGKRAYNHIGNQRFRAIIESQMDEYSKATTKLEKSLIVSHIIDCVRQAEPSGGFVREEEDGTWVDLGDAVAREKVGQGFRDLLHTKYKSSTKAKKRRRVQMAREKSDASAHSGSVTKHEGDNQVASLCEVDESSLEKMFHQANTSILGKVKRGSVVDVLDGQGIPRHPGAPTLADPVGAPAAADSMNPFPVKSMDMFPAAFKRSSFSGPDFGVEPVAYGDVFSPRDSKKFRDSFITDLNELIAWDDADLQTEAV